MQTRFGKAPCKCGLSFGPRGLVRSTGLGHICELVVQVNEQLIVERLLRPEFHLHESRFYSCLVAVGSAQARVGYFSAISTLTDKDRGDFNVIFPTRYLRPVL